MNNLESKYLISVKEAKEILAENISRLNPISINLDEVENHVLSMDILAPWDIPAFRQSSVDGYAIRYQDFIKENRFILEGESAAGNPEKHVLKPHHTERVFTGAPIPEGADTMIMQEKVSYGEGAIKIQDLNFDMGNQVREIGSEIRSGQLALAKGTRLSPSVLGFLANIGISRVWVYPKPRISLFITGNELQAPGKVLEPGKVFESNSFSIQAALNFLHFPRARVFEVKDDLEEMQTKIREAIEESDLLIFTGGVSVGDYDFTPRSLELNGFRTLFHKIRQRPGKPFLLAKKDSILAFGLPGNPGSVLTGFYQYVVPALEGLTGLTHLIPVEKALLGKNFKKMKGLTFFTRGLLKDGKVYPLGGQESYKMGSYSEANCLLELEEDKEEFMEGEIISLYRIP